MKYCIGCGAQLKDNDLFCTECGLKVGAPAPDTVPEEAPAPEPAAIPEPVIAPEPEIVPEEESREGGFNAGRFFKTFILVILPIISAAMLYMNWTVFKGASSSQVGAIISTCAGYTDNGVVNAMGDGGIAPSEFSGMADSVAEIARFLAYSGNAESVDLVADIFRVLALCFYLSLSCAVVAIIFRAIRPLKKARNLDFGFFFLQIVMFVSIVLMNNRMNSFIEANSANAGIFQAGLDLKMSLTAWSIIALVCAIPSCLIDLIKFPGERRDKPAKRSALPVITGIGSVLLAGGIVFAALYILTAAAPAAPSQTAQSETPYEIIYPESETSTAETSTAPETTAETTVTETTTAETSIAETTEAPTEAVSETESQTQPAYTMDINQTLGSHLKIAANAFPISMEQYVYAYTDRTLETVDESSFIDCYADQLLIMDVSSDGSALEIKYPAGEGYKVKWFDTWDILGECDYYPQAYTASRDAFSYVLDDYGSLKKVGFIRSGDEGIILGTREIDGEIYELTLYPIESTSINEVDYIEYSIALIEQGSHN